MALDSPFEGVKERKVHFFGAFQQCVEFFIGFGNQSLAEGVLLDDKDVRECLVEISMYRTLFDAKYLCPPQVLQKEADAWEILSGRILDFDERLTAFTKARNKTIAEMQIFLKELVKIMKDWGIISSSFKMKLENIPQAVPEKERLVEELIERLRAETKTAVTC